MKDKKHKYIFKQIMALLLCTSFTVQSWGAQNVFTLSGRNVLPAEAEDERETDAQEMENEEPIEWDGEAAIYWNPGEEVNSSYPKGTPGQATKSNGNDQRRSGSDHKDGLTPDTAVKSLNTAVRKARGLSRKLEIEMEDIIIYAMNPMVISSGVTYTVSGKGVSVVPWSEREADDQYLFILDGGTLSLSNIILRSEDGAAKPEETALLYNSSGIVRLGAQVESYGTFVFDYTNTGVIASSSEAASRSEVTFQTDLFLEPKIELTNRFDMAGDYILDLHIPEDRMDDVIAVDSLYADTLSAHDFMAAFTIHGTTDEWQILTEERVGGVLRDTTLAADADNPSDISKASSSVASPSEAEPSEPKDDLILTQKSLLARRTSEITPRQIKGMVWLDQDGNGIMTADESGIPDYPISLYDAKDRSVAVQSTKTLADGSYHFDELEYGSYVVGITPETVATLPYQLPVAGIASPSNSEENGAGEMIISGFGEVIVISNQNAAMVPGPNIGLRPRTNTVLYDSGAFVNMPLGGNILAAGDASSLVVMEADGDPLNGYYQAYPANVNGLRSALFDLYQRDIPEADYVIYFGADISNVPAAMLNNTATATGTGDITFASLRGRLNILVITGKQDDPIKFTPATSAPAGTRLFAVTGYGERYLGSHLILRNIRHTLNRSEGGTNGVYMNGYSLTLGGDSWQTAVNRYFGGASSGNLTTAEDTAQITVYSTGTGTSHFIGGMRSGTLYGNAAITIHGTSGNTINVYGGGLGASGSLANITGNVTTTIHGLASNGGGLNDFRGGAEYGNVGGQVTNKISGTGRFSSLGASFVGGSFNGNIGSDNTRGGDVDTSDLSWMADTTDYIIKNIIDTSSYTYGRASYVGTNDTAGIVKGNIVNDVKAGSSNRGSYGTFSGGSSIRALIGGSWQRTFSVTSAAKVSNIEAGLAAAEAAAKYRLYGNITTVVRAGSIAEGTGNSNYYRGAGWGYMEGNAYSELGTEGVVYEGNNSGYVYSTTNRTQGYSTGFDLVGGGGTTDGDASFCIKGNTTLVTKNIRARWTYGGNFGGVLIGDSLRVHSGGIVDTCEGTGYINYIQVGNGRAEVHGGQVDWFLSGGGWGDDYQDGNVSVEVFDKPNVVINASMGGTYGYKAAHYISGDSSVVVHGGNFSGTARTAVWRGFSAGPSNSGTIYGDASVTIDLRGNQYGFSIESGDSISGGRRWDADTSSYLGTDKNNTITLSVFTDESQTDLLNGLNIYGDCSSSTASRGNTRAGTIIINVNAPGANIGNLYATSYPNLSNGRLLRDVQVNLVSARTLTGLCAGNGSENLTNAIARDSEVDGKRAVIHVGPQSDDPNSQLGEWETGQTPDGLPRRINISTNGINGFTAMDIQKRLLVAQNGNIKNGSGATVATHGSNYHEFGDVTLHAGEGMAGAGLGITSANASFIAGSAYIEGDGKVYIQSTGQANQIVLTDIIAGSNNALSWLKVGNVSPDTNLSTNWFGASSGWRVITLNPDKMKAQQRITPINFRGTEESTGKAFIGDSDTHFAGNNGYAVALLGSIYTWKVTEGNGAISHNVPVSTTPPAAGETIKAYGTVPADTPSTEGNMAIPSSLIPGTIAYPSFTFVPEPLLGDYVKQVDIIGSDQYVSASPHIYQISAGEMGEAKTWTASGDDKEFSFDIEAAFARAPAYVRARNVIITETEAAAITNAADVITYQQASGGPLFRNNITDQMLVAISAPLGEGVLWRPHLVSYHAGDPATSGSEDSKDVRLIVVKDGSNISTDRQYAVYAQNAVMTLEEAQALSGRSELDGTYTYALAILANGTTAVPLINNNAVSDITGSTAETIPKDVLVRYSYTPDSQLTPVTKEVTVRVEGPREINLTVAKLVEGNYIDKTKEFSFTMYFQDSSGTALPAGTELLYTGGIIAGSGAITPADGRLTLAAEGKAEFTLKHGQQITIINPESQGKIRIVETADGDYQTTFTDSGAAGTTTGTDTGVVDLIRADRTFRFINTRIKTAVYIDGSAGNDNNDGYVPARPVKTLEKAYEVLKEIEGNVIYVVGTVLIRDDTKITSSQYQGTATVNLTAGGGDIEIRRFATPMAGEISSGTSYDSNFARDDFLDTLFYVENGAVLTVGDGILFDGHYSPRNDSESTKEFFVDRNVEALSPLIQVEAGAELKLQNGSRLTDNHNTKTPEQNETKVPGGAVHNSGTVELDGAVIKDNKADQGAGIYQDGIFEIHSRPAGIVGQQIYLTTEQTGSTAEPVWGEDHIIKTAVWLPDDLKLDVNMDHAVAGRPVIRYTNHSDVDPQWKQYTLDSSVPATLFLVESASDNTLLELQDWRIMDVTVPTEIFLAIQQTKNNDIGVKRADSDDLWLASPAYQIQNGGAYETKVWLSGFMNRNAEAGITNHDAMNLVASPSNAVGNTDLYLAIQGTVAQDAFNGLPETSLYDFLVEGRKQQELGVLGAAESAGFKFVGTASRQYIDHYVDPEFPFFGANAETAQRITHIRNKDLLTGLTSANYARAKYQMTYRIELVR